MNIDVILTFKDGRKKKAALSSPFSHKENTINVFLYDGTGQHNYPFEELGYIGIMGTPAPTVEDMTEEYLEEVETITGERQLVRVRAGHKFQNGFYGIPVDKNSPYKSLFYFSHAVKILNRQHLPTIDAGNGSLLSIDVSQEILGDQREFKSVKDMNLLEEANTVHKDIIDKTRQMKGYFDANLQNARIGDILVSEGLVTKGEVEKALGNREKKKIGSLLIERGLITEDQLLIALATKFRLRHVDLAHVIPNPDALNKLSKSIVNQMQVLPLEFRDKKLVIATSEPADSTILDRLCFITSCNVELVTAFPKQISEAINRYYNMPAKTLDDLIIEMDDTQPTIVEQLEEEKFKEPDSKVIRFVNNVLLEAYQKEASDIHFEPGMKKEPFIVRYRVDGECFISHQILNTYKNAIISRLKIIANLDISERRRPQSGKIILMYDNQTLEYRLEITPTIGGQEDAVLRVLTASKPLSLHEMGFSHQNLPSFRGILAKPYGIILCVGPTGSGKTTTLHSALAIINSHERKIWTVEDPVEIVQKGLRQVQVNTKIGLSFQEALRSFLRADPDVIMIGEIRDKETAKTAIAASLTGHLVFSTLHTNSAPETVVRLIEMGMEPYNFADALLGILAQRLARRLCSHCRVSYHPSHDEYNELAFQYGLEWFKEHGMPPYNESLYLMKKAGCEKCSGIGYKGRIAIHELLIATPAIKDAIKKNSSVELIRDLALRQGMRTLKMDGIDKVFQGITDLDQVTKVCLL
jgi:type II secretory ATPase GspE/PulE/Tfp pilus assembly ATPase PilB-like protein